MGKTMRSSDGKQAEETVSRSTKTYLKRKNSRHPEKGSSDGPPAIQPTSGKPWSELQYSLRTDILEALHRNGFSNMFPVQQACIPMLLKNYDLAVEAQTGSGKTLSFLVPLLEKYLALDIQAEVSSEMPVTIKYVVISPTRELSQQTFSTLTKLLNDLKQSAQKDLLLKYCHCVTGGNELEEDVARIEEKAIVLVGTVGRLKEITQKMSQNWLKKVEYLFIDEADRVLKEKGIEELLKSVQKIRRTAIFSATLQGLQQKHYEFYGMRNLAKISLKSLSTEHKQTPSMAYVIPKSLHNTYLVFNSRKDKIMFLINFLANHLKTSKAIVFFNTCASVDYYAKLFQHYFPGSKDNIDGIHGKLKNRRRSKIISHFLAESCGVLFATDVVSRGIDFNHIHYIVQIDPPEDPDNYVHRIGRTARINRPGTAILLIEPQEETFIEYLAQKRVGVERIRDSAPFLGTNPFSDSEISLRIHEIMTSDRDFVEKAKRAFVSYVRSYKEHDLKYIFEFKNLDIGMTAHSFFLFTIPRIKQILGKNIATFIKSEFDVDSIPWKDKNQQLQYLKKRETRLQEQSSKPKRVSRDYKNIKSERRKVREKNQVKEMKQLNSEHKKILKSRKTSKNAEKLGEFQREDENENTQSIEERVLRNG